MKQTLLPYGHRFTLLAALTVATVAFVSPSHAADAERAALDRAVQRVFPALVRITVIMEEPGAGRLEKHTGAASGAIISEDGYIITNHHVAGKARHLLCRMADGESVGSLGGAIPANLARSVAEQIIQKGCVERSWTGLEPQPMLRGSGVDKGVLVAGVVAESPAAEAGLRAGDIVTEFDGVAVNGRLQEDLPVFNALVMSTPVGKPVKVKALRDGQEQSFQLKQDGARVAFVFPGGAAEQAGIRAGDILTRFDGETVRCRQESDLSHFLATVRRHQTGNEVECGLLRDGQLLKLALKLQNDDPDEEDLKRFQDKELEFNLRDLTEKERVLQRIPAGVKGPRVTEVQGSGWASLAHVAVGDLLLSIYGSPTPDVAAAERLLKAAAEKKPRRLVFHLRRGVHTLFAEVEPTWDSAGKP